MRKILNPLPMFFIGALLGVASKLFDIYTQNLGNMFSEMSIWILFGVVIAVFSKTPKDAIFNILPFCIGMLITYYATAELTHSVYGYSFIIGWTIFSLCSPLFAFLTWHTKSKGVFPKIISAGILIVTLAASIIVFDGPRLRDILILAALVYILFFCKVRKECADTDAKI